MGNFSDRQLPLIHRGDGHDYNFEGENVIGEIMMRLLFLRWPGPSLKNLRVFL